MDMKPDERASQLKKITILVVDDHPFFRKGVVDTLQLEPDFHVLAEAASGEAALRLIREKKPEVALLDVNMPGMMNGQQVTYRVFREKIPTRIILLTGYEDDVEHALHAARAGAYGFCSKQLETKHLARFVRDVANGKYVFENKVLTRREMLAWLEENTEIINRSYSEPGSPYRPLSDREKEVLDCVVRGMSNKEIAALLNISHQTVKNHVTSILRKFGVEDRTQAVVFALRRGWVTLKDGNINRRRHG